MEKRNLATGLSLVILIFVTWLFGLVGLKTIAAIVVFFILPFYWILNNFNLKVDEKIFFSLFIGLAMFALTTWYINRIIPSLRASIGVAFIVLIVIGFVIKMTTKFSNINKI